MPALHLGMFCAGDSLGNVAATTKISAEFHLCKEQATEINYVATGKVKNLLLCFDKARKISEQAVWIT
jgi:hypothetical protein